MILRPCIICKGIFESDNIAFAVDNLDEEATKLEDKGVSVIVKGKATAAFGSMSAHFDTRQVGDFAIQLIQEAK